MKLKKVTGSLIAAAAAVALMAGGTVPVSAAKKDAGKENTVHFLTAWNEDKDTTAVVKQLTEEYNATNPETPINLEIEVVAQSDMNQKLSVLAASNDLPDLFVTGTQEYIEKYVDQGILKNIDDVIAEQGVSSISDED